MRDHHRATSRSRAISAPRGELGAGIGHGGQRRARTTVELRAAAARSGCPSGDPARYAGGSAGDRATSGAGARNRDRKLRRVRRWARTVVASAGEGQHRESCTNGLQRSLENAVMRAAARPSGTSMQAGHRNLRAVSVSYASHIALRHPRARSSAPFAFRYRGISDAFTPFPSTSAVRERLVLTTRPPSFGGSIVLSSPSDCDTLEPV